jgi:predicted hydrocarbon binding protein
MDPIPKSEYHLANKFALISIKALEDVLGRNGINALLRLAHLPQLVDNYPPDNLNREFNFADFSAINLALEDIYGSRGGQGLALRAGRAAFVDALRNFGALAGVGDPEFKSLPLQAKLRIGIPAIARIFSQFSDQNSTVTEEEEMFIYTIHRCPACWGRSNSDKPVCFIEVGLLQEGVKWVSGGGEFHVYESKCLAMGDAVCEFVTQKTPLS